MKFRIDIFDSQPHDAKNEPMPDLPANMVEGGVNEQVEIKPEEANTEVLLICPDCGRKTKSPMKQWPIKWGPRPESAEDRERRMMREIECYNRRSDSLNEISGRRLAEIMLIDKDSGVDGKAIFEAMDRDTKENFTKMANRILDYIREDRYYGIKVIW